MNIYVGNLPYSTSNEDLRAAFEAYGQVSNANVVRDKDSGESRGFGLGSCPRAARPVRASARHSQAESPNLVTLLALPYDSTSRWL